MRSAPGNSCPASSGRSTRDLARGRGDRRTLNARAVGQRQRARRRLGVIHKPVERTRATMPSVNCRAPPHSPAEERKLSPASVTTAERLLESTERWERERPDDLALRYLDRNWTWGEWAAR